REVGRMTAILVVAAPRKVLRQRTCKIAPESRYTADWYGAIGSPQTMQTLTSTGAPLGPQRSRGRTRMCVTIDPCPHPRHRETEQSIGPKSRPWGRGREVPGVVSDPMSGRREPTIRRQPRRTSVAGIALPKTVVAPTGPDRTCTIQVRDFITR